jgi:hypothetical protein
MPFFLPPAFNEPGETSTLKAALLRMMGGLLELMKPQTSMYILIDCLDCARKSRNAEEFHEKYHSQTWHKGQHRPDQTASNGLIDTVP